MPSEAALHAGHGQRDRETQEKLEQLEWDRLQREALAAQRDRLEQELLQARKQGLLAATDITDIIDTDDHHSTSFLGIHWNYRWLLTGIVLLMIGGVVLGVVYY